MSVYVFDTSAINHLSDDDRYRNSIVKSLIPTNCVWISALNIMEIARTSSKKKRNRLLALLKTLSNKTLAIDIPSYIVQRSIIAYKKHEKNLLISVPEERGVFNSILTKPEGLKDDVIEYFNEELEKVESNFLNLHENGRISMQKVVEEIEQDIELVPFIDHELSPDGLFKNFFNDVYKNIFLDAQGLTYEEIMPIINAVPEIMYFFTAWMYSIYERGIAKYGYGKKNAGNVDLWFAPYLARVDYIITADIRQYGLLKFVSEYHNTKGKVLLYDAFKKRMKVK